MKEDLQIETPFDIITFGLKMMTASDSKKDMMDMQ